MAEMISVRPLCAHNAFGAENVTCDTTKTLFENVAVTIGKHRLEGEYCTRLRSAKSY